jgi:DNA-binding response OmpR family regulator
MARILLVEDEDHSAEALEFYLTHGGHRVIRAACAEEALRAAPAFGPDLLLTDLVLRGDRDGIALARALRECDPAMAVVVMSGLPGREVERRAEGLEVARILAKPTRLATVGNAVSEALAARRTD